MSFRGVLRADLWPLAMECGAGATQCTGAFTAMQGYCVPHFFFRKEGMTIPSLIEIIGFRAFSSKTEDTAEISDPENP